MGDGAAQARGVTRAIIAAAVVANLVGAATVYAFLQLTSSTGLSDHDTKVSALIAMPYIVVSGVLAYGGAARLSTRTLEWLAEGREPTEDERVAVLRLPWRAALHFFAYWVGGAILFGLINGLFFDTSVGRSFQVGASTLLGGLTTCMIFFLFVERLMRPVFATALSGGAPARPSTIGIRPRLLLSWALGSGVVLLALILLPVAKTRHGHAHLVASIIFLAIVGIIAGLVLIALAARSVADPIERVRMALRRVQAGDLDVSLTVDDGGEVGLLQAGFNDMVAGLRERLLYRELLDHHIGDEVARYAIEHGVGLGGEVRDVSALFVDVIGSTALAQERAAPEVVDLLNELFRLVVRAVSAEGGWVNKFEGDAALCVFGAPDDQPDHAARALRAARCLRHDLSDWRQRGGLDAAVGVSSGTAVAGNVGSEQRYEYTVVGDPVNEAARLSEVAKARPERIAVSGASVAAADGAAGGWSAVGAEQLRGRAGPTQVFVVQP